MPKDRVELLANKAGEWYWHRKASNGKIVLDSAESYTRKSDAKEAAIRENPDCEVVDLTIGVQIPPD